MTNILGLSGSLRRHSYNTGLLRAAQGMMSDGTMLTIGSIAGVPLYDGDLEEAEGIPPAAAALKEAIAAADGLLIATPEYNNGMPGVLKNAWLPVFRTLGMTLWTGGRLMVAGAGKLFDDAGDLTDPAIAERIRNYVAGFVAAVAKG